MKVFKTRLDFAAARAKLTAAMLTAATLTAMVVCTASCATTGTAASRSQDTPSIEDHDFEIWSEYLLPDAVEGAWLEIPWIPALAEGVRTASEEDRPILLWVMNGHPLGCT